MRKILFVEQNQDGTIGGSHYSLLIMLKALDKDKFEPIVLFYENISIMDEYQKYGKCIIYPKPTGKALYIRNNALKKILLVFNKLRNFFWVSIIPIFRFVSIILKEKIDVVHLNNNSFYGWEWLVAAKICGRKCISHQRGGALRNPLKRIIAGKFDIIICISKFIEKVLNQHGVKKNTVVIYNAIDVDEFKARVHKSEIDIRKEFGICKDSPIIGMVGNFQSWKGQKVVVNAVAILKETIPDIVCFLIGGVSDTVKADIEYYNEVKALIDRSGLSSNIHITGYRKDIPDLLNALNIQIHASIRPEPFGRVILEGMSLGKSVIATDMGGPREIIQNNVSGFLIKPDDATALSKKIQGLLSNSNILYEIGNKALDDVATKFSIKYYEAELNNLYEKIL